ncbi:SusD/RagB family nutrient-binding outer membrane lipoprotein [Mucilaginibacter sp. KACC 22063]|uniref:SusD/RagB family nutrient-binding outer membrane lipoprotein n=1 Tax=Mucilaginibacter sp. KACC 22063 TaxID=3025666 RepID=UPI002366C7DB|nr:SusD/RagB family nutrient-binding outer membrane lipoprotein [Mucilaginibacter sp. KACC 22063]WDF54417.1 SusD/RagB family nutrient-binding outer membrane lipoprotein [Mucilaginibacter sp. KACC 22063]
MRKLYTLSALALTLALGACKKDYFDINTNPNNATSATPGLVLTNALNTTARVTTGSYDFYRFAGPWLGYWNFSGAYSGFLEERSYNITSNYAGATSPWANLYDNLEDYNYLEQQGKALGKPYFVAFAKTMKAFDYAYLVDFFNDVPYTQALQSTKIIRPQYDKGQAIYEDLSKQLDSAVVLLKSSTVASSDKAYDIIYGSDLTKWGKLANTIRLRLLLRQSEMPGREAYIKAEVAKIIANGYGFIGAGETANVQPGYSNTDGKQNPFYANFGYNASGNQQGGHQYYLAAQYGLYFYINNGDPRYTRFYTTINDGAGTTYEAHPFGPTATDAEKPQFISAIGPALTLNPDSTKGQDLFGASKPQPLITDFESLFLQAEAAQRGWITGTAETFYAAAVTQSFIKVGLTAADATTYMTEQPVANWNDPDNVGTGVSAEGTSYDKKLILIIRQKWAALNGFNDIEAWSDYRRLGLPADIPISNNPAATTRKIPVRMPYPQSEYNYNSQNVIAEGTINQFTSRVFWDVK